jgi:hypothetical protein
MPPPPYGTFQGTPQTNGMAIASLVCSILGMFTCGLTGIVGAILGHVARKQIAERGEGGDGMALAGIIIGWIVFGLSALGGIVYVFLIIAAFSTSAGGSGTEWDDVIRTLSTLAT